jgi:hypothetical protein
VREQSQNFVVWVGPRATSKERCCRIEEIDVELLKTGVMMVKGIGGYVFSRLTPSRVLQRAREEKDTLDLAERKK